MNEKYRRKVEVVVTLYILVEVFERKCKKITTVVLSAVSY